jgi:hypothetical protein
VIGSVLTRFSRGVLREENARLKRGEANPMFTPQCSSDFAGNTNNLFRVPRLAFVQRDPSKKQFALSVLVSSSTTLLHTDIVIRQSDVVFSAERIVEPVCIFLCLCGLNRFFMPPLDNWE